MSDAPKKTWEEKEVEREAQVLADRAENQRRYEEDVKRGEAFLKNDNERVALLKVDLEQRQAYMEREVSALERIASVLETFDTRIK